MALGISLERFGGLWFCLMGALAGMSPALAQEESTGVEAPNISILGTYADPDDNRGVDDGRGLHVMAGWALSDAWQIGLNTSYINFDTGVAGTDFYRAALGVDLMYFLNPEGFAPFALASVGAVHNDVALSSQDQTAFTAGAGLGLLSPPFTDYGVRIRAEVRYVYDDALDKPEDTHFSLGVMFPLRKPKILQVVQTEIQEREVIKEVYREVPVPQQQPVRDTDKDGVPDERDVCPDTLAGADVDERGCVRGAAVIQLTGVYFENNSSRLTENSKSILAMAAASLRGQSEMRVEVAGHTDDRGKDEYNLSLSRQRAVAVVDFLANAGIERGRLQARGYGESQPVDTNDTDAGRERNRRVEFRVLPN